MKPKYLKLNRSKSGNYHMSGTIGGQRIKQSTGTDDIVVARTVAFRKELEVLSQITNSTTDIPFIDCVRRYERDVKYDRKNQHIVDRIARYFDSLSLYDIDQDIMDQFVADEFTSKSYKYSTAHRNLTILIAIRNHAVRCKLANENHMPYLYVEQPSKHNHRMSVVDVQVRDQIIELARAPYDDVFTFLFYSGSRLGCALNRRWTDRISQGITLYSVKGGRSKLRQRREYLVPEVRELTTMLDRRFNSAQANPGFSKRDRIFTVSDTAVREELARVCGILNVDDFLPHDIRHCFGTYLAKQGMGIEKIADLMGHDSLESARIYINHANEDLQTQLQSALSKPVVSGGNVVVLR